MGVTDARDRPATEPPLDSGPRDDAARPARGWRRALQLSPTMVDFETRGFRTHRTRVREALERSAGHFIAGFNAAVVSPRRQPPRFAAVPDAGRGFAVEGSAMAAAMLDLLAPMPGRRLPAVRAEHEERYVHLIHVGVGWAMAKLRWPGWRRLAHLDPLLRWLAHDGWGFERAFFADRSAWARLTAHRRACGSDARCAIRHQGMGRALWFRTCADPRAIAAQIRGLVPHHRGDVWSGVGLAAMYAGGVPTEDLVRLRGLAGPYSAHLAQGAAFGAEAWRRSGGAPAHAHDAVRVLAGTRLDDAADWTVRGADGLDRPGASAEHYQEWRRRIREQSDVR